MNEHFQRLQAMADDDSQTWDLSEKDYAAIQWALSRLAYLDRLERKVAHGCIDAMCEECD